MNDAISERQAILDYLQGKLDCLYAQSERGEPLDLVIAKVNQISDIVRFINQRRDSHLEHMLRDITLKP